MRIDLPEEHNLNPVPYVVQNYAPEIAQAGMMFSGLGYQHSTLSFREFEAARIRTAQINGCQVCKNWRSERDLPSYFNVFGGDYEQSVAKNGPAPDEHFYEAISDWQNAEIFSTRERLAMEYAEGMGTNPQGIAKDEDFWGRAKAAFSDYEIVDLSYCLAAWIGLGRVTHVLGLDGVCELDKPASIAEAS